MAQKFIINGGEIRMSASVDYHAQLARDHSTTKGGGLWSIDDENKTIYLWGASADYGPPDLEELVKAVDSTWTMSARWKDYKVMYSGVITKEMPKLSSFVEVSTLKDE